jgi:tripartite-type tricarboxylate transporter receptor subunit TctC
MLAPLEVCMLRRSFLAAPALLAGLCEARADSWPSRPVTLLVPLAAGSTADIFARIVAAELGAAFGQQFVVENRVGAGGNIGMAAAARATPDGYTLAVGTNGPLAINVGLYPKLPFDPIRDFTPIMPTVASFNGFIVPNASPARSVRELIDHAKARPGALNYSSGGRGTTHHLSAALFAARAGLDLVHVPYKGAAEGVNAVMAGEVALGFFNLPNVVPLAKDGQLRALAVTGGARSPLLPDAPTMVEAGVPDYETSVWFGLFAPASFPEAIAGKLRAAMAELMRRPAFVTRMQEIGFEVMPVRDVATSTAFLQGEIDKWVRIVELAGAKAN